MGNFSFIDFYFLKKGQKSPIVKAIIVQYNIITQFFCLSIGFEKFFRFFQIAKYQFSTLILILNFALAFFLFAVKRSVRKNKDRKAHFPVHCRAITDKEDMRHLIDIGADGIVTGYPSKLAEVYEEYNK